MKKWLHHIGNPVKLFASMKSHSYHFAFKRRMRFVRRTMQYRWCGDGRLQENWPLIDAHPMPPVRTWAVTLFLNGLVCKQRSINKCRLVFWYHYCPSFFSRRKNNQIFVTHHVGVKQKEYLPVKGNKVMEHIWLCILWIQPVAYV